MTASTQGSEAGIESHLPQMAVRILEVARVAAVERCLCRFDDAGTGALGLLQDGINFSNSAPTIPFVLNPRPSR